MKHQALILVAGLLATGFQASAQNSLRIPDPLQNLSPAETKTLANQASSFFSAAKPAVAIAAKSTVTVSYRNIRVAYGTVVTPAGATHPSILTKWSEVSRARNSLIVTTPDGKSYPARVSGVYPEHDLALLSIKTPDATLVPLDLTESAVPALGNFIILARTDGNVEGLGIVSVQARSLRDSDRAYLGVQMDFATDGKDGISLKEVIPGSAASKAGLRDGDVILSLGQTAITGAMELGNLLQLLVPGTEIVIRYRRGDTEKETTVSLGSRDENQDLHRIPAKRMNKMERMGTVLSRVRTNFPNVIQSDMPIQSDDTPENPRDNFTNDCGGPVVDLDGKVVGIAIARGSRIKTYIIPTSTIQAVLATPPIRVNEALAGRDRSNTASRSRRNTHPRAIPADKDDTLGKVKRLLGEIKQNNEENAESLRKIEKALKNLKNKESRER